MQCIHLEIFWIRISDLKQSDHETPNEPMKNPFQSGGFVICDPPQDCNAKGESTRMTRFHFKTK